MMTKAYVTSYEKPQEYRICLSLKKHDDKAVLCPGTLVAQMWPKAPEKKTLSLPHGTHTDNEPSWQRGVNDAFSN